MKDKTTLNELLYSLDISARHDGVTKYVAGAVPVIDGGVLIIKRIAKENFLANYWELPSGGMEASDTTIFSIAERELREETGLEIKEIIHYLGYFDYETKTNPKVRQWNFLVQVSGNTITLNPEEHDEYRIIKSEKELSAEMLISSESRGMLIQSLKYIEGKRI